MDDGVPHLKQLKPGMRLRSAVCTTEIMVIKTASTPVDIACGGASMLDGSAQATPGAMPAADAAAGTQMGKRYVDEAETIEVLCVRAGAGSLAMGGELLRFRESRALPTSD